MEPLTIEHQTIYEDGKPRYAVLDYSDFRQLAARLQDLEDLAEVERILADEADEWVSQEEAEEILLRNPVKTAREKAGITQKELARRMSISQAAVSKLERKFANPTRKTLERVAKALGGSVEDLI